jgi:hypothetical protein
MQSLLIDTNILVLLIVGSWDRESIRSYRRTAVFTPADYDLLQDQLRRYARVLTTQGVLTETSNLMGSAFHVQVADTLVQVCSPLVEVVRPKETVFAQAGFDRLGFADASVLVGMDNDTVLLTGDVALYLQALSLGREAINFNHLRKFGAA